MEMFRHSLRSKLLLPLLLGGIATGALGALFTYQAAVSELRHQIVHRGHLLGTAINRSILMADQESEMRLAVKELVRQEDGVSEITVVTADPYKIWASNFQSADLRDLAAQSMPVSLGKAMETGAFGHSFEKNGDLVLLLPIGIGASVAAPEHPMLNQETYSYQLPLNSYRGAVYLHYDWKIVGGEAKEVLWRFPAIFLVSTVLIALFAFFLVSTVVLGQVRRINGVFHRLNNGDDTARIGSSSGDEIGRMADAFDEILESLNNSQKLFDKIFRASPALTAISTPKDGSHFDVNAKWTETLGYSYEEAMQKTAVELGIWANYKDRIEFVKRLQSEGSVRNFEANFMTKDHRKLDVLIAGELLEIADEDRLLIVITDITERKNMERALQQTQKMEAVGQLTGGVAHDFNNLLAVIMGNSELLKDDLGSDQNTKLDAIIWASIRGSELTQRLLAFSRRQYLEPQNINLGALVSGMLDMLTRTLGATVEASVSIQPDLWAASADPGQVENVLLNLALNSRDSMPRGGKLAIECANARVDEAYTALGLDAIPGDYVVLQVSDEGCGMTDEVQTQAFEPFFTTKEVGQGSGLGLSMIYGFAKQSGGHVTIYSELGKGTTVRIYLPRTKGAARQETVSKEQGIPHGNGEVILVIEDDPDVSSIVANMLGTLGYRVIDVVDAAAAQAVLANGNRIDLVLSDVVLPGGVSGPEFAEAACATYSGLKVIFMSGYPADAAKRNGVLASDQVLLSKPFQLPKIANAIRDALA